MILLIDNYDSFTYNLYQQIEALGKKVLVVKHDQITIPEIEKLSPQKIVISPGPGKPEEGGISKKIVQKFYSRIPILGVCLGHEIIGQLFSSKVVQASQILHGKTSEIYHNESTLFSGVKNPFTGARYHSLILGRIPKDFTLTAWTKRNEIMAIQHNKYPLFGIQFHPESFLTKEGKKIMNNFLNETAKIQN